MLSSISTFPKTRLHLPPDSAAKEIRFVFHWLLCPSPGPDIRQWLRVPDISLWQSWDRGQSEWQGEDPAHKAEIEFCSKYVENIWACFEKNNDGTTERQHRMGVQAMVQRCVVVYIITECSKIGSVCRNKIKHWHLIARIVQPNVKLMDFEISNIICTGITKQSIICGAGCWGVEAFGVVSDCK